MRYQFLISHLAITLAALSMAAHAQTAADTARLAQRADSSRPVD